MGALTAPATVLAQLLLHRIEHRRSHERRHRHADPFGGGQVRFLAIPPWLLATATQGPQSRRAWSGARLAEGGLASIGRVPEQAIDRRALPCRLALASRALLPIQTPAYLPEAEPVTTDPVEDLADHLRLLLDDLVPRNPAALLLADVAIAVRRMAEHTQRSRKCSVPPAAATPLQDLGALILRHHALHLQQQ